MFHLQWFVLFVFHSKFLQLINFPNYLSNIQDLVKLINIVIEVAEFDDCDLKSADLANPSSNLIINVLDAVFLLNVILGIS